MIEWMEDYLPMTQMKIRQRKDMFRMNSDTRFLGEFLKVRHTDVVLDIGTNNGALLLYASLQNPSYMIGIDILQDACELAAFNLARHAIMSARIDCARVQEYRCELLDVIVCNPPYFHTADNGQKNIKAAMRIARHEEQLTLQELCEHSSRLLKDKGKLYMVHRTSRLADIVRELDNCGFGIQRMCFVHDENKEYSSAVLVEAQKGVCHKVMVEVPIMLRRG